MMRTDVSTRSRWSGVGGVMAACAGLLALAPVARAQEKKALFDGPADLAAWTVSGGADIEAGKGRDNTGGALRLPPGAKAIWKLRDQDASGSVTIWVYDDGTAPADPKQRRAGPQWGVLTAEGRVLVSGHLYAPYLAGEKAYALTEYSADKKETPFQKLSYLGLPRKTAWRAWTFAFDPDKGLTVTCDGKDVNAPRRRYDWNNSGIPGFVGVYLLGDTAGAGAQTVWVDEVDVTLGGPMNVKPVPPPPPPPPAPVVPDTDPAVEGESAKLLDAVRDVHPRLLFGPGDVERMRAFYNSPEGEPFRKVFLAYLPSCNAPKDAAFLSDATDGQRQGYWRMPTVALHYVLTGDKTSLERSVGFLKMLMALDHWETGEELDSGMSAANIMIGAGLTFDWVYNDLDPAFREQVRAMLIHHARAMYYGGHLMKNPGTHYWQNDPANNHRWHRNAGMVLCTLAAANGSAGEAWILSRLRPEMDFVTRWLPEDGTCHEGPGYLVFGSSHLTLAVQAMDRCIGTTYLQNPFFKNAPAFFVNALQPGLRDCFPFGDAGGGIGSYAPFLYKGTSVNGLKDLQAAVDVVRERVPDAFQFAWFSLVWYDPAQAGGKLANLPMAAFFKDIGTLFVRDGWEDANVGAMFRCGPFGGYALNAFRNASTPPGYINVAHDDPDANSFVIRAGGELVAETDGYSKHKKSANHNTILVNDVGQTVTGRPEGGVWSQPGSDDMTKMAVVTAWKDGGNVVGIEGEAAGSYPALSRGGKRPALDRYRRVFLWVKGGYVLVLDDIRAPSPVDVDWLMQGADLQEVDAPAGRYRLAKGSAACDFQVVSDVEYAAGVVPSPADNRGKELGWKQLRLRAKTAGVRFASVYDPWKVGGLTVSLASDGPGQATVTVTGKGIDDRWTWQAGQAPFGGSTVVGKRGEAELFKLGSEDAP